MRERVSGLAPFPPSPSPPPTPPLLPPPVSSHAAPGRAERDGPGRRPGRRPRGPAVRGARSARLPVERPAVAPPWPRRGGGRARLPARPAVAATCLPWALAGQVPAGGPPGGGAEGRARRGAARPPSTRRPPPRAAQGASARSPSGRPRRREASFLIWVVVDLRVEPGPGGPLFLSFSPRSKARNRGGWRRPASSGASGTPMLPRYPPPCAPPPRSGGAEWPERTEDSQTSRARWGHLGHHRLPPARLGGAAGGP